MKKPDDSSLDAATLAFVEARARNSLDKASAWGRFPTPVDDILAAAKLHVAPKSAFDPASLLAYAKQMSAQTILKVKNALSKVLGLYDAGAKVIHIDPDVAKSKQQFLKLHETGHHELPTHRKIYTFFQDNEDTLSPDVAEQFEREANNFARFVLFQDRAFQERAADMDMRIVTPMKLAGKFGASVYASAREFARTNHRACAVIVLNAMERTPQQGVRATVRRVETSPSFRERFGVPSDAPIGRDHALYELLPIGRKMTNPSTLVYRDKNGDDHECVGEAFNTTHNVILLLYPLKALTGTSIIVPANYRA